jgi:trk system potassium uptake protein TrkA
VRLILAGGGETIETIYYLARLFAARDYHVTVVDPDPDEARWLSRRVDATVILGDASDPAVLEDAGARQADVLLALAAYDPDNLVTCQVAHKLYGVPRTMALVNDPDNEGVFQKLGIDLVFSATRVIGSLIEEHTVYDEIVHLFPAAEGQLHVTEVVLDKSAPAVARTLAEIPLPADSLVAAVVRGAEVIVPGGDTRLQVDDRLILISSPQVVDLALRRLAGDAR